MEVIINFIITLWKKPMGKVFIGFFLFLVSGIMGWFIIEIKNDIWFVRLIFEGLAVIIALWGIIETPIKFTGRNAKIKRRRVILKKSVSILLILVGTYFGVVFTIHNSNRYLPREYKIMQEAQATREADYWAGATEYALESS